MAAVLGAFVSKLAFIMMGMAKDEVEMLLGVPGEITKLETTIGDLSSILADAERKRIGSTAVERWVRELKDAMYDVDDILDLSQIMEAGQDPTAPAAAPKPTPRCWSNITNKLFCFRNPVAAHEIGKKIQALNKRLSDIAERSSRFGFIIQQINSTNTAATSSLSHSNSRMTTGASIIRSDVVGENIEQDTKKIVDLLIKKVEAPVGSNEDNVVIAAAITGAGGIGKTTLARMVFNDNRVEENFDRRIWLSVNKEVNQTIVLQNVIAALGCSYDGSIGDKALLEHLLKLAVQQKKFLLVMDDVWSESQNVWSEVLRAPLNDGAPGSCVLVTTRNDGVARKMKAQHLHRVHRLQGEDAWILLKNQVVLNEIDELEVVGLKDIGIKIVERCDGLPLAIKVLGGLLLNISRTRDAWLDVCNHFAWSIEEIGEDINKSIYLSYEELPSHLKQCFLYCSLFPKDELIRRDDTIQLWIAEGYVHNKLSSKLLEDLGLEYYKELVSRNLLEPNKQSYNQSLCTMHDVVRSFAQYITKDEGVIVSEMTGCNNSLGTSKLRHLSISKKTTEWGALQKYVSLRTLMLFRSNKVDLNDFWRNLSSLRAIYLYKVDLAELPDSICHLKHLRYLALSGTPISTIPQDIGNLIFLQALDLVACSNISQFPYSILKLQKLRLLDIRGTKITSVPRGFGKLEDLVILAGFPTNLDDGTDDWCSLEELGSLSKLKILDITGLEKASSGCIASRAKLCSKNHLKELSLNFTSWLGDNREVEANISMDEQERIKQVLGDLFPPTCIEELVIKSYFGSDLPRWTRTMSAFGSLRKLVLEGFVCCKQLPSELGQLPYLYYFWVEQAPSIQYIGHDFLLPSIGSNRKDESLVTGTRIDSRQTLPVACGAGVAFPKLTRLGFENMLGWTEWDWEQHVPAMPMLEGLMIDNCKLQRLPPGLAHHACRLALLDLRNFLYLVSVENFPSLIELKTIDNPRLERISNCPSLRKITIFSCPELKLLEDLTSLGSIEWKNIDAETLPEYLQEAHLNKLNIYCHLSLLKLISLQDDASEWSKIRHVQQLKAYACGPGKLALDGYIYYTRQPYSFHAVMYDSTVHLSPDEHE